MPKVILFRHAKAAQALPGQKDFDRPLTDRGRRDATCMGNVLAQLRPDLALVSAAARTRETFELASAALAPAPRTEIDRDLYLCGAGKLIRRLTRLEASAHSVVVVGHNPEMQEAATWLAGQTNSVQSRAIRQKYPTAAIAAFDLDIDSWADLEPSRARLERFAFPAELDS